MPYRPPIYSDFFDPPLTEDVEELLGRFQQMDSVRYGDFAAIWREMRFSDVFLGFHSQTELKRFGRVTLATAVKYFLPPYSYQIRVGGLYLMHALYHAQLAATPVSIRLALKDWTHLHSFLQDSVDAQHHDVVYILLRLEAAKAFHYTAMPHFLTFQKLRTPKKEALCTEFLGRTTAVHDMLSLNVLEEMTNIERHYEKLKEATEGVRGQVALTQGDFTSCLKDTMSEFLTWQQKHFSSQSRKKRSRRDEDDDDNNDEEEGEEVEEAETCSSRARLLSSIKQKSYGNFKEASKSRRHRPVEAVDPGVPGPAPGQRAAVRSNRKRPVSLRSRTCKSLGAPKEGSIFQPWTLSAVENQKSEPESGTS